jgi:hypothetical protein
MARPALADGGLVHVLAHELREAIRREALAQVREEEMAFVRLDDERRLPPSWPSLQAAGTRWGTPRFS